MGTSTPPAAAVDLVGSYARRRGDDVELVLADPKTEVSGSPAVVTLTKGSTTVAATGGLTDAEGLRRLVVRAPRNALTDGTWGLTLRVDDDTAQQLEARLMVQGERPVVLLWGAKGQPSTVPSPRGPRAERPTRRRAAAAGGRVIDRALKVLPDDTARTVRARIRTTARKVLR